MFVAEGALDDPAEGADGTQVQTGPKLAKGTPHDFKGFAPRYRIVRPFPKKDRKTGKPVKDPKTGQLVPDRNSAIFQRQLAKARSLPRPCLRGGPSLTL